MDSVASVSSALKRVRLAPRTLTLLDLPAELLRIILTFVESSFDDWWEDISRYRFVCKAFADALFPRLVANLRIGVVPCSFAPVPSKPIAEFALPWRSKFVPFRPWMIVSPSYMKVETSFKNLVLAVQLDDHLASFSSHQLVFYCMLLLELEKEMITWNDLEDDWDTWDCSNAKRFTDHGTLKHMKYFDRVRKVLDLLQGPTWLPLFPLIAFLQQFRDRFDLVDLDFDLVYQFFYDGPKLQCCDTHCMTLNIDKICNMYFA